MTEFKQISDRMAMNVMGGLHCRFLQDEQKFNDAIHNGIVAGLITQPQVDFFKEYIEKNPTHSRIMWETNQQLFEKDFKIPQK